jgi:hypothetical protein
LYDLMTWNRQKGPPPRFVTGAAGAPQYPDAGAFATGGSAYSPIIFGIGADPGHHEHRKPSTRLPTEASGWRSMVRISIARFVRQLGQCTSKSQYASQAGRNIVTDRGDADAPELAKSQARPSSWRRAEAQCRRDRHAGDLVTCGLDGRAGAHRGSHIIGAPAGREIQSHATTM